mgnify:CR=1 FL=1
MAMKVPANALTSTMKSVSLVQMSQDHFCMQTKSDKVAKYSREISPLTEEARFSQSSHLLVDSLIPVRFSVVLTSIKNSGWHLNLGHVCEVLRKILKKFETLKVERLALLSRERNSHFGGNS